MEYHKASCYAYEAAAIILPEKRKFHRFKKIGAIWFVPLVIYLDIKSLLVPIDYCTTAPHVSSVTIIEEHVACGYAFAVVEHGKDKIVSQRIKRAPNCLEDLIIDLEKLAKEIYNRKQMYRIFRGVPPIQKESVNHCWICETPFEIDPEKVLDHCHYSGKFLGWAHSGCNLSRKSLNFTPVIAHNMTGLIFTNLQPESKTNIWLIH